MIGVAVLAVAIVALGLAGYAYAQTPTPPTTPFGPGGRMGGQGGRMGGMMGGLLATGQEGPMHEYMLAAMAEALDMSVEDLQAELDAGKTMWQVAEAKGLSLEEFQTLMADARSEALKQAVEAGTLTQEQADWMLNHMQGRGRGGQGGQGGQGACPMHGGGGGPGRWNSTPANPAQPQG